MPKREYKPKPRVISNYRQPELIPGAVPKMGGVHKKEFYYNQAARYGLEAINLLVMLMRESNNPFVKIQAAKTILNKTIPDLKAIEITGDVNQRSMIVVRSYGDNDLVANTAKEVQAVDNKEPTTEETPK